MQGVNHNSLEIGVAQAALPGEREHGDRHAVTRNAKGVLVGVIDGLGHGSEAGAAAELAAQKLRAFHGESVLDLLRICHEGLRRTRGAVMSVASFDLGKGTMTWLGIGNVEGVLCRGNAEANPHREYLLCRPGVVGRRFEQPVASVVPIDPGDLVVLATDGLDPEIAIGTNSFSPQESPQRIADRLLKKYWKRNDDALVLVARYQGGAS